MLQKFVCQVNALLIGSLYNIMAGKCQCSSGLTEVRDLEGKQSILLSNIFKMVESQGFFLHVPTDDFICLLKSIQVCQ